MDSLIGPENERGLPHSIVITAAASPGGNPRLNRRLSERRVSALATHIRTSYPDIPTSTITVRSKGADWKGLLSLVENDTNVPERGRLIALLNSPFSDEEKEKSMRSLNDGETFAYVSRHFLPQLWRGMVCIVYYTDSEHTGREAEAVEMTHQPAESIVPEQDARGPEIAVPVAETSNEQRTPFPPFALKTNLLFDAASVLNVEVEIPLGQRWSLNAEYMFPWWQWLSKHYTIQTLSGNLEGRYWLGDRMRKGLLEGFFVGAYGGGGYYDIQLGGKGWQGEFYIAIGASVGYTHRIGRRLGMEYSIGLGYMHTKYREYDPADDCKVWRKDGRWSYFGPTKIKVSLVWMLGDKKRWQK